MFFKEDSREVSKEDIEKEFPDSVIDENSQEGQEAGYTIGQRIKKSSERLGKYLDIAKLQKEILLRIPKEICYRPV